MEAEGLAPLHSPSAFPWGGKQHAPSGPGGPSAHASLSLEVQTSAASQGPRVSQGRGLPCALQQQRIVTLTGIELHVNPTHRLCTNLVAGSDTRAEGKSHGFLGYFPGCMHAS